MNKEILRTTYLEKRSELDIQMQAIKSELIINNLLNADIFAKVNTIFLYNSFRGEVDLSALIEILWSENKRVFVPVTTGYKAGEMQACEIKKNQKLISGKFGILEPETKIFANPAEIELVLMPAVALGMDFSRLGYGAGYYDRFLAKMPPDALKIGIAYQCQIAPTLPQSKNDQKLSAYCTEEGYFLNKTV